MILFHSIRKRSIGSLACAINRCERHLGVKKCGDQLKIRLQNQLSATPTKRWASSSEAASMGGSSSSKKQNLEGLTDDLDDFDFAYDGDDEGDEAVEEEESLQPWKGLLEAPARATWRVADPELPTDLGKAYEKILLEGDRTPKQLKRAHKKVLSMHSDLTEFRERERRRLVNGKSANDYDGDSIHPVYYGHEQTLSTLKHRLLPNYAIAKRVLEECRSLLGPDSWSPKRIVDFGIGCGSSSAAALDMFDDVEWIHGIDPSQTMRECSQRLIEGMTEGRETAPRVTYSTSLSADSSGSSSEGSFDLAICAYTATDVPGIMSTLAATAILFEKLKPNGIFVMIEPGTPDGFNSIRSVRNMLLDCCPPDDPEFEWEERCHIIAPCTHNGQCPMERHKKNFIKRGKLAYDLPQEQLEDHNEEVSEFAGNLSDFEDESGEDFIDLSSHHGLMSETDAFNSSFCSFVQSIPGQDSRKKGEKFSYLVAQKRIFGRSEDLSEDAFKHDRLTDLLARAHDAAARNDITSAQEIYEQAQDLESRYFDSDEDDLGLELIRGEEKRGSMGRIIRAPIKKKGHVYIDYCAAPGRIIRSRVTKSASKIAPGIYSAARKSRWGGLWPDTMDRVFSPNK